MKLIVSIILTALLAFAIALYFSWWMIAVAAFIVAVCITLSPGRSFLAGFTGIFLLWGTMAFLTDKWNEHILASRIALVLPLDGSVWMLILITALIGGLIGGLGALTGSLLLRVNKTN